MNKKGAVLIGFLLSGVLVAQEMVTPGLMPQASIRAGTSFQMWKVDPFSDPVTQISLPISMAFPLGRHFRVSLQQTPGFSWWQPEDDPLRLYGLSDTWVKGALLLWEDKLMLHAGMGLPTGRTRLDSTEYELVSKGTSRNVFRFSLPVYGQGFTGTTGFAFAFPVIERVILGAGAYYIYRAPYYPLQYVYSYEGQGGVLEQGDLWNNKYKPGDEVSGHIGLDAQIGDYLALYPDDPETCTEPDTMCGYRHCGRKPVPTVDKVYHLLRPAFHTFRNAFRMRRRFLDNFKVLSPRTRGDHRP